jgi:AcrR family transcriptional regulator
VGDGLGRARSPGRPRTGAEALTREGIVRAAIRLVDEHGMDALSMRRLAGELGVDPMAIYHHLPGKAAVVSGMVELVFREMPAVPAEGFWRERVRAFAEAYRGLALAHPNLVLAIVTDAATATEAALRISGPLYAALEDAGLTPAMVWQAGALVVDYVHGYVLGSAAHPDDVLAREAEVRERLKAMGMEVAPALQRSYAAAAAEYETFGPGLEMILRGIEVTIGPVPPGSVRAVRG